MSLSVLYGNAAKCLPSLAFNAAVCKRSVGWGALSVAALSFNSLNINWYVTFDSHCWITLMTLMWQTQFSRPGCIRVSKSFCPSPHYLPHRTLWLHRPIKTNKPPIQFTPFCHQIVLSLIEHHGCPSSLFVFCSTLSGAVESNNCVSCSAIVRCSLFLSALYWNLDLVPLRWLSPSVSEELMVSPSPCEFPPLQLNYPFSPYCSLSHLSIFPILWLFYLFTSSLPDHYIFSILLSLCLTLLPSPFSTLSQFSLPSYLFTSIALFCLQSNSASWRHFACLWPESIRV